tara:strand:- start:8363 stop:8731 length:369 start_codon:yes stop_codon:yes gene_type:complete
MRNSELVVIILDIMFLFMVGLLIDGYFLKTGEIGFNNIILGLLVLTGFSIMMVAYSVYLSLKWELKPEWFKRNMKIYWVTTLTYLIAFFVPIWLSDFVYIIVVGIIVGMVQLVNINWYTFKR